MSLLIKALDKAEKAQVEQQKLDQDKLDIEQASRRRAKNIANDQTELLEDTELTLAEVEPELTQAAPSFVGTQYSGEHTSERANNMFASKVEKSGEIKPIVWIVLIGVLSFLGMVGYFYYQLNVVQAPAMPIANPVAVQANNLQQPNNSLASSQAQPEGANSNSSLSDNQNIDRPSAVVDTSLAARDSKSEMQLNPTTTKRNVPVQSQTTTSMAQAAGNTAPIEVRRTSQAYVVPTIASDSASIQISRNQPAPAVNPILMSAYQAYSAGNYNEAQGLYKRVLQRDTRNVDAMLGLGAIAERQGRMNDAFGWYQKVLEVDPKNAVALSAYANYAQDDQSKVLKLKSMLADNPNDANAHASLGAHFAEQTRWAEAQQAYFDAFRLNPSAENAFNLAISLDQMGKPALALPYYKQSLDLVTSTPSTTIDINALQARITAIQSQ
ncbi:MAG: tetratricopeptide repeat protein [Methylophilus sp.]|nr:tetratricopeptide repeat protein [Methylophilus sp.]